MNESGTNPLGQMVDMFQYTLPLADEMVPAVEAACEGATCIGHTFAMTSTGHSMAQALGVPEFGVQFFPIFTRAGELPSLFTPDLGGPLNRATQWLNERLFWWGSKIGYEVIRRRNIEVPPLEGWPYDGPDPVPMMLAVSAYVLPDFVPQPHIQVPGYFFLEEDTTYTPPADLAAFIEGGEPPVYIGFGSMISPDTAEFTQALLDGLREVGARAVINRGWGLRDLTADDPNIHLIDNVPHDWLLPRMTAVMHHGGAGTTAAGLRAGRPTVIVPFTGDQPFWAKRLHALGVAPEPVNRRQLTAAAVTRMLNEVLENEAMRQRASQLGERVQAEGGVQRAADRIEGEILV